MIKEDEARLLRQTVDLAVKSASDASGRAQRAGRASMAACGAAAVAVAGAAFFGGMLAGSLNGGNGSFAAPVYAPVFAGGMPHASADSKGRTWDLPAPGKGKARRAMWTEDPYFVPAALESGDQQELAHADAPNDGEAMTGGAEAAPADTDAGQPVPAPYGESEEDGASVEPVSAGDGWHAAAPDRLQMVPLARYRSYADRCRILGQPVPEGTFCFDSRGHEMFCMRLSPEAAAAWDRWDLEAYRAEAAEKQAKAERKAAAEQRRQAVQTARPQAVQPAQPVHPVQPAPQAAQAPVQRQAPAPAPAQAAQSSLDKKCGSSTAQAQMPQTPAAQTQDQDSGVPDVAQAPSPDAVIRGMAEPAGAVDAAIAARKGVKLPTVQQPSRPLAGSKKPSVQDTVVPAPKLSAAEADIAIRLAKGPAVPIKRELSPLQKSGRLRAETSDPRAYPRGAQLYYSGFVPVPPEKLADTNAAVMGYPKITRERLDALLRDAPGIHLAGTPKAGRTALAVIVQPGCTACMAVTGLLENQAADLPFPVYFIPANSQSALALYPAEKPDQAIKDETDRMGDAAAEFLASTGRPLTPTYIWAMDDEVHAGTLKAIEVTAVVGLLSAHARACGAKSASEDPKAAAAKDAPRKDAAKAEAPKADAAKAAPGAEAPKETPKADAGKAPAESSAAGGQKTEAAPEKQPEAKAGTRPERRHAGRR